MPGVGVGLGHNVRYISPTAKADNCVVPRDESGAGLGAGSIGIPATVQGSVPKHRRKAKISLIQTAGMQIDGARLIPVSCPCRAERTYQHGTVTRYYCRIPWP
jgi:hypothetical protein